MTLRKLRDNMFLNYDQYTNKLYESAAYEFLFEGGSFGHMAHPYDDINLTFSEVKDLVSGALQGGINSEVVPTEKLDGQAIAVSWRNGELVASRNKGDRANSGERSMTVDQVIDKFKGRGELSNAFSFAMKDLSTAISKIDPKQRESIFKNGKSFMHLELVYPPSTNVINYGAFKLIFHNATEYDEAGDPVGEDKAAAKLLSKLIKDVDAHIQKTYEIEPPKEISFTKNKNFEADRKEFFNEIAKIQKESGLSDNDSIRTYIRNEYEKLITSKAKEYGYVLAPNILEGLINRFAFQDKTMNAREIKTQIKNRDFVKWLLQFDKKEAALTYKSIIGPFEKLFLRLGVKVIRLATGILALNPDKVVQDIKDELEKAVVSVRQGGTDAQKEKLERELEKLNAIGGFDAALPSEGVVIQHKGKTYKLTGSFAPINQILGIFRYG